MNRRIIVVGAGPAGLSAAIEAARVGFAPLVVDKGGIVNSIQNFPPNMIFFSTSDLLEIAGVPFVSSTPHPTRNEAVNYYARVAGSNSVELRTHSNVLNIARAGKQLSGFNVEVKDERTSAIDFVECEAVVIATGFYDNPNLLGVPGETLPIVSHYYTEPGRHFGERVVIVGGKNSAVEAALDLYRHGVNVALVHRHEGFGKNVKYWILPDIENRVRNKEIGAYFNSIVAEIKPHSVVIDVDGKMTELPCDFVYALTGYHPNTDFLNQIGIEVDAVTGVPQYNPETFESNISGVYVAGSIVAGYDCNKIFIENGREHGKVIARSLSHNPALGGE